MICINCLNTKTSVTNSRTSKKMARVWRRRYCDNCNHSFTTYEKVSLPNELVIDTLEGPQAFNSALLIMDIAFCLDGPTRADIAREAYWLAQSVEEALSKQKGTRIPVAQVKATTHRVLSNFNQIAGIKYAAKYSLLDKIKPIRRRSNA